MKKKEFIILLLSIVVLTFLFGFLYNYWVIQDVRSIKMQYTVADVMGLNLSNESLNFGKSYPGSALQRRINITNGNDYPIYIAIKLKGDISPLISVSNNNFKLLPGEKEVVTYYLHSPKDMPYITVSGETVIYFKRFLIENYI